MFRHSLIVLLIFLKCGDVSKMNNIYYEYAILFVLCKMVCAIPNLFKTVQGSLEFTKKNKAYHESHRHKM